MQIKDLPSTSTVNSTDVLAKETSGGTTNKLAISDFVVNNLTSTSTTKALSAAAGNLLNNRMTSAFTIHQPLLGSYKHLTANGWEDTGLTITVPTNHVYIGTLNGGYASGKPIGIGVNPSSTLTGGIPAQSAESADGIFAVTVVLYPGSTWHVFTKRATVAVGANNYYFRYVDLY